MADNVPITAGSGTNIATDEVTGTLEHVQLFKIAYSADGVRTLVPVDANGVLVNLGTNNDVTVTGTATVSGVAADGAAVSGNPVLIAGQDGTNAQSIKTDAAGELQVDVLTLPALVAGTANIGDVDVLTVNGVAPAFGSGVRGATVQRVTVATDDVVPVSGTFWQATQPVSGTVTASGVSGDIAHDTADSGNPVKVGAKAIAHGANPTAVAAADRTDLYANRHGIQFVMGGHPNTITRSVHIADSDGAQTNASISGTIAAGTKVVVTAIAVTADGANTGDTAVKIGFGTASVPADSATGANGVLLDHDGIKPGSGVVVGNGGGILGIGADDEELRLTCEDPVGGAISITFSYYTIES